MVEQFRDWFIYNSEANSKVITSLAEVPAIPEKVTAIFSHLLLAHQIWIERAESDEHTSPKPWDSLASEEFYSLNTQNLQSTLILLKEREIETIIEYTNTKGIAFSNSLKDILFHILTHSSYHRGQIALLLRMADCEPPMTDYIFYKR